MSELSKSQIAYDLALLNAKIMLEKELHEKKGLDAKFPEERSNSGTLIREFTLCYNEVMSSASLDKFFTDSLNQ